MVKNFNFGKKPRSKTPRFNLTLDQVDPAQREMIADPKGCMYEAYFFYLAGHETVGSQAVGCVVPVSKICNIK